MATEKKTATVKPIAKAVVAKAEEVKAAPAAVKTEEKKEVVKKAPAKKAEAPKKEAAKKAPAKKAEAPKVAAKKAPAKKAAAPKAAAKKATANLYVQFADKSYSMDELVKIAEDVWVYDLGKKLADMKSVEIYVKPEESRAYFVVNGSENGSFLI